MTAVESRIEQVTLYAQGARVRRVATLELPAGSPGHAGSPDDAGPRVRLVGLPIAVIDDTVRIEAAGAVVVALHVGLDAPDAAVAADEVTPEVLAGQDRVARGEAELARLDAALTTLAAAPVAVTPALQGDEPPPAWDAVVTARRALVAVRVAREQALRTQAAAVRRDLEIARLTVAAAIDRDRRAGSARAAKLHELRKHVELELAPETRDAGDATAPRTVTLHLEYQVAAARWAPSYVARIDGDQVGFELRASVAQATGEDWTGVALRLSTAEPERFAGLPELASQRIGRRQADPARAGFRAPPIGAAGLFADYLQTFAPTPVRGAPLPPPSARPAPMVTVQALMQDESDELGGENWDDETSRARQMPPAMASYGAVPRAAAQPARPQSAPMAMPAAPSRARPSAGARMVPAGHGMPEMAKKTTLGAAAYGSAMPDGGGGGRGGAPQMDLALPAGAAPARLDYANLRMAPPGSADRGQLIAAPHDPRRGSLDQQVALQVVQVAQLALPAGCRAEWPHTYDYAFATDGRVDVRADAGWHSIAVTARPGTAKLRHVAVPREQPDVFRLAVIANPLAGPLLPGPIDVYDRGSFLVTSTVDHTPPGATLEIGLGVDAKVKLSRNTEFREETAGMLRGALRLHHAIKIDVDNLSERAIELEVRERLPVAREGDDDVEVIAGKVDPAWERWTPDPDAPKDQRLRGGYRWRIAVPAGAKRALRAAYEVKIAGKHELVGGNRRES